METLSSPRVLIIILTWNGLIDTIECLDSISKIHYSNYSILVVDNGSDGDDVQGLKAEFGASLNIIEIKKNCGFAGGINTGISYALNNCDSDYMLLLNNDIVVEPDFLDRLIVAAETDSKIGLAGPKVLFYDNPQYIQNAGNRINMVKGITIPIAYGENDSFEASGIQTSDYLDTAILVKTSLVKSIGLFDESYFCYWEDADYGVRAARAGYKVINVLDARVWHKKPMIPEPRYRALMSGRLFKQSPGSIYYLARNTFKFLKKYGSRQQYRKFLLYFFCIHIWYMSVIILILQNNWSGLTAFLGGVWDGLLIQS